jgi:hypothetical protein
MASTKLNPLTEVIGDIVDTIRRRGGCRDDPADAPPYL